MLRKFCAVKKALVYCAVRHRTEYFTEVYDYRKPLEERLQIEQSGRSVKCVVIHPIFHPNYGPSLELYYAEEAIALAKTLQWDVEKGPFWVEKLGTKTKEASVAKQESDNNETQSGHKDLNGTSPKDTVNRAVAEDPDMYDEWKTSLVRHSLAKNSLIRVGNPNASTFFGKGAIERMREYLRKYNADALFINTDLNTSQMKNISETLNQNGIEVSENQKERLETAENEQKEENPIRLFDRFMMILQVLAKHAKSPVAKLQIELAYLKFLKSRVTKDGMTSSELNNLFQSDLVSAQELKSELANARQKAASGEPVGKEGSVLELENRIISEKENKVRRELLAALNEKATPKIKRRKDHPLVPRIALVGFTNAGKSALLNQLTTNIVKSEENLFKADPTDPKKIYITPYQRGVVTDTIGFITNLPQELDEAFKTTLEEAQDADIILHVRDISHPQTEEQKKTVLNALKEIEPEKDYFSKRIIEVWNKIDILTEPLKFEEIKGSDVPIVPISALYGMNMKKLFEEITKKSREIFDLRQYHLFHHPDTHQDQMRWLAEQGNVWSMIDPVFDYQITEKFPMGYISFHAYLDDVTYRRYQLIFKRKGEEDVERRKKPPSDYIIGTMSYHERKRIRERYERQKLEEEAERKRIQGDKETQ